MRSESTGLPKGQSRPAAPHAPASRSNPATTSGIPTVAGWATTSKPGPVGGIGPGRPDNTTTRFMGSRLLRLDATSRIIPDVVYQRAHRVSRHLIRVKRPQKPSQPTGVVNVRVEPDIKPFWQDHDRHALVYCPHRLIGLSGQDRAGLKWFALLVPTVPQARDAKRLPRLKPDVVRLLPAVAGLPLEEAVGGDPARPRKPR